MMGSSRRRFSEKTREPRWVQDWVDAELVERVEAIEEQIAILDVERAGIETEFFTRIEAIEAQVESLENERDRLELDLFVQRADHEGEEGEPSPLAQEQAAASAWPTRPPLTRRTLALLITVILGPWVVIAAIVWLLFG